MRCECPERREPQEHDVGRRCLVGFQLKIAKEHQKIGGTMLSAR